MDEFFQKLREIQKKERNLSGLAPVGENFYQNISRYFNVLMKKIDDNPFSFESYLLRDAQRITAEICERREHKISNSAVMSVQREYRLFKESESDSPTTPKIPRNSTPEEEKLFYDLVDSLTVYREKMRGPLRFQSSQVRDRISNIPDSEEENIGKGTEVKASGAGTGVDTSDIEVTPPDTGTSNQDDISNPNDIGFTPEEEAAIEDDIYKQFGKEPFPGDNKPVLKEDKPSTQESKPSTQESKPSTQESKPSTQESKPSTQESKPSTQENKPSSKESKPPSEDDKPSSKEDGPSPPESKPSPENKNQSSNLGKETAQTKDKGSQNFKTDVLMVLEELPSIMGVDKQVYGPLLPQDIVTIPEPNARILIKNQKGKSIQNYK